MFKSNEADPINRLPHLEKKIARLTRRAQQLESLSKKYWRARRVLFLLGSVLALVFCQLSGGATGLALAVAFMVAFVLAAIYHGRVRDSILRNNLLLRINMVHVARLNLDWAHMPRSEQTAPEADHPFEIDLDVTGERSLHRLLDSAVTKEGSRTLKSWLLHKRPDYSIIQTRQSLIQDLKRLSLFRDKLHLCAAIASIESKGHRRSEAEQWDSEPLVAWIQQPNPGEPLRQTVVLLTILAAANITLLVLALMQVIPHLWPITFLAYVAVSIAKQGRTAQAWGEVRQLEKALRRFGAVFSYLESRSYAGRPRLAQVCAPFLDPQRRPSAELRRVERIAAALGLRTNGLLWLLVHAVCPWDFFFTYRLEELREEIGHLLPVWLDAWYELEALNSLASFAYLNSGYVFPEVVLTSTRLDGRSLGHPLIKAEYKICNDLELDEERRMIILTGSNMAGKSTFLRTVGLNLCLAYTGAPVNAERLHVSLFRVFTCIKVNDSVQDGLSYFYAEVKRLKLLLSAVETGNDLATFVLIDEIFRGTNNRERHLGSHAFVQALSGRKNALGLIATHDLELTKLAEQIRGIANFHFREEVSDGKMVFDYLLRPGPCPTTNALKIMRIEGLPIDV